MSEYAPLRFLSERLARLRWRVRMAHARQKRKGSRTTVIGITGSSGKSTTAALTAHILEDAGVTGRQIIQNNLKDIYRSLIRTPRETDYFVAEVAIGPRGHMRDTARFLQPDMAIVTLIGIEHYSWYRSREAVAAEKGFLVENIRADGLVLLNADDPHVMSMADRTSARAVTFGRLQPADYRVVCAKASYPDRLRVRIAAGGTEIDIETRFAGEQFWLSTVAAFAAASELGMPADRIAERIRSFAGLPGRCEIYPVAGGPTFILDTVKAPGESLNLAFATLADARSRTKRIVLGQISDYKGSSKKQYRDAYLAARAAADQVIFVGAHGHRAKASDEDRQAERYLSFETPAEVDAYFRNTAGPDDAILLKGSENLHLERIALNWDKDVRCWEPYCGISVSCRKCGLFMHDFADHPAIIRSQKKRRSGNRIRTGRRET